MTWESRKTYATWLYGVSFLVFAALAAAFPENNDLTWQALLPVVGCAMVGAVVGIVGVWAFSNLPTESRFVVRVILAGAVVDIACNLAAAKVFGKAFPLGAAAMHGLANLGLLAAAIGAGLLVGRGLQKPNYLVVAATVGAVTDVFSVYGGPSKHVLASEDIFPYISFHWGMVGTGGVNEAVGAGDFIFLALYFYGARKFGLNERKTLIAMMVSVVIGLVVTYFGALNGMAGVPALPFFSVGLLLVHRRELKQMMAAEKVKEAASQ